MEELCNIGLCVCEQCQRLRIEEMRRKVAHREIANLSDIYAVLKEISGKLDTMLRPPTIEYETPSPEDMEEMNQRLRKQFQERGDHFVTMMKPGCGPYSSLEPNPNYIPEQEQ